MKKISFLLSLALFAFTANAQLTLSGSSYTQNFDTIAAGLPIGWAGYTGATASSLGTPYTFDKSANYGAFYDTTDCPSDVFGKGFKNCASADVVPGNATCAVQSAIPNRAFGLRQTSTFGDPGAAFVLHLTNTTGYSGFSMQFNLQSLDSISGRATTWTVDYGFGPSPGSFTPIATTGFMVTGNYIFSNNAITVNFGSALDNQSQDVWIRIDDLTATQYKGNRATTAIDDFVLNYTAPNGIASANAKQVTFKVLGNATSNGMNFACNVAKTGDYTLNVCDITGRSVYSKQISLKSGTQNNIAVNANLVAGMYIARITNGSVAGITKVIVQ